ncbi:non-canonical poly(A) RNA polymerase protein Trf4-1-like [Paramacrobiotus metropolitanus]|uniref:non-canonical poly(A) RNA polymerase protein Trf4-1-like n=1 Tax=Paramacrobiotus metropolitanus TaxID=2943436 RepID=UPI0024460A56|nr:non-canonical poly(A) RNA polymerase protein Trf4-1-like [Paramacrobiotus metropolitanus]XP_055355667.1 non-canonical poly(A) RNA polymerase protein Trf4-1-like [Paramacrobiotus metropolitanus]XP_055355668.1 non-canonical poly(A) RNA polymerase protein Trf4-1-like [Paramacrobiotus metropolitanus]
MGTFLPSSDIDVAVTVRSLRPKRASPDRFNQAAWLANLRRRLVNTPDCGFTVVEFRKSAKEPLLIIRDVATQIEMDINCGCNEIGHNGLERSLWIVSQLPTYKNLVALVVILKDLLRLNVLSDVRSGGFSSYVLTLMVLGFLQRGNNNRNLNLGDLLLKCLKFYGSDFDFTNNAIVVTDGGKIISKKDMQAMVKEPIEQGPYLCIQQPTDPAMDAAKSSCKGTPAVQEAFRRTYDRLMGMVGTSAVNGKDILHTAFA